MTGRRFALNDERACLALSGEEARSFLQGMVSNDVDRVDATHVIYAGFLTAQGRFLHDLFIVQGLEAPFAGALLLDGEAARLDDLKRRLTLYKLRAKAAIADARDALAVAVLWGEDALAGLRLTSDPGSAGPFGGGIAYVDPRLPALGARAILPRGTARAALEAAGFTAAPLDEYRHVRLSLGVPEGSRDLPVEKALLLENGFEELNGVDFKKGCYVGQEVTARMKYRALIKRRLLPVAVEGAAPAPGTPVMLGDEEAGEIQAVSDGIGLALLKLEAVEAAGSGGRPLIAGGATLRARRPAWLKA